MDGLGRVSKLSTVVLLSAIVAVGAWAEEREVPELGRVLVIESVGSFASDAVHLNVSLRDESGKVDVRFPSLVGPVHLSVPNAQLFS